MNEFNVLPLFSTPLYQSSEELPSSILDYAKKIKYRKEPYSSNIGVVISNRSVHPDNVPGLFPILKKHINNYLFKILELDEKKFNYKFADGWFVKVDPGGHTAGFHRHEHSLISGVIYLSAPENAGDLSFSKVPFSNSFVIGINLPYLKKERHILNADVWNISPKTGDILIFPSQLNHSITTNNSNEIRYSYAFNIVPVGVIGNLVTGMLVYS